MLGALVSGTALLLSIVTEPQYPDRFVAVAKVNCALPTSAAKQAKITRPSFIKPVRLTRFSSFLLINFFWVSVTTLFAGSKASHPRTFSKQIKRPAHPRARPLKRIRQPRLHLHPIVAHHVRYHIKHPDVRGG